MTTRKLAKPERSATGTTPELLPAFRVGTPTARRRLDALMRRGDRADDGTLEKARAIVDGVRRGGDRALRRFVRDLDRHSVEAVAQLRLTPEPRPEGLPTGFVEALEVAVAAVAEFHQPQVHHGYELAGDGVELTEQRLPLGRVGIYAPGGRACYPSTLVMTVVPARLAGVEEIVVATPPGAFYASPALRYTLARLGVDEVWGMGGAHAIATLAYGTATIGRVDKIVGPGNAWVTAAKRLVVGDVAIDGLAGPTEVLIAADDSADPALIAADLLAQAEHDPQAAAVLVTDSPDLITAVRLELAVQLVALPGASNAVAGASLANAGTAFLVDSWEAALALIDTMAPEHLQLLGPGPEFLVDAVRNAGAIFVGASTPEVFGDYVAGPSHVLPTGGTARFASSLGVEDFVRRSHIIRVSPAAALRLAPHAAALADAEGLPAHAAAARRRLI
jgi:histidinol dehydrogenase